MSVTTRHRSIVAHLMPGQFERTDDPLTPLDPDPEVVERLLEDLRAANAHLPFPTREAIALRLARAGWRKEGGGQ